MRLLAVFETPDFLPLERGAALPQYHQDGDRYTWRNDAHWNYQFWYFLLTECRFHPGNASNDEAAMLLMGGEL